MLLTETRQSSMQAIAQRKQNQEALNSFLLAADGLARGNRDIEAELRYLDALRGAEKNFGKESDQAMLVASILASFYRSRSRQTDAEEVEARLASWSMEVVEQGISVSRDEEPLNRGVRPPAVMRRACQILGIGMNEFLTPSSINRAWKKQMLSNGAHPDLGGNTDEAVLLNQAKEELLTFLVDRGPKLGKVFKRTAS